MYKTAKIFQMLTYWPIFLTLKILWRYEAIGQENLKGLEDKGVIFASNHASYLDGPVCAAAMPRDGFCPVKFFPIRFLALRIYCDWFNPFPFPINLITAAYVKINGSICVDKAGGDLSKALADPIEAIKHNQKIWFYPEGGITSDGKLQAGKRGVVFLHQRTGAPIIPVALIGTFKMARFKRIFGPGRLMVKIGKPLFLSKETSMEKGASIIMQKIAELMK
jgi:1-acyl-sn-glycerol-3-phosphate acyltransferase